MSLTPELVRAFLDDCSQRLHAGRRPRTLASFRKAQQAASALALLAASGCGGESEIAKPTTECSGESCAAACTNRLDDDGDGKVDCADNDCAAASACQGVAYGIPLIEARCGDGTDDDGDGKIDCADSDCLDDVVCMGGPEYGVPLAEDCATPGDEDGDGNADCADSDCRTHGACQVGPAYGIPLFENCSTPGDEDGDQLADCADSDCANEPLCQGVRYGVPLPPM